MRRTIELKASSHSTEKSGERLRDRQVEWSDTVSSFSASRENNRFYIDFICTRVQRFVFSPIDFLEVVKTMIDILPLSTLCEVNRMISQKIAADVELKNKSLREQDAKMAEIQNELRAIKRKHNMFPRKRQPKK